MTERDIQLLVYLYVFGISAFDSILAYALHFYNHKKTARYLPLALVASTLSLSMGILILTTGTEPFFEINGIYLIASRLLMAIALTYLALHLIARIWLTLRGEIPHILRVALGFKERDV